MKISTKKQTAIDRECTLIRHEFEPDSADFDEPVIAEKKEVFCGVFSITEAEHYDAAKEGLRMVAGIIVNSFEENGADEVELDGEVYAIERKYERVDGYTEIYLREK